MAHTDYQRILITGAAGRIGAVLRQGLRDQYPQIRITDVRPLSNPQENEEIVIADIRDMAAMEQAMDGVEAVVHLAGTPSARDWATVTSLNIQGTYAVFEAARREGVSRIVFASTMHTMGMYPVTEPLTPDDPVRADSYYGVSKVFGEALLRYYVDKHGLSGVCLRIGSFASEPKNLHQLQTWISHRDMVTLVHCALRQADIDFVVVFGFSKNAAFSGIDPNAAKIAYRPLDNAEDYRDKLRQGGVEVDGSPDIPLFGGFMTAKDFDIDVLP